MTVFLVHPRGGGDVDGVCFVGSLAIVNVLSSMAPSVREKHAGGMAGREDVCLSVHVFCILKISAYCVAWQISVYFDAFKNLRRCSSSKS